MTAYCPAHVTVVETIQRSADFLQRKGIDSARLQAELLLAHVLSLPRIKLYLNFDRALTESELNTYRSLVQRRATREPLQHIVGSVSFYGHEVLVSPAVLIPRPETELLVERAISWLKDRPPAARFLDYGTGSGCIALALAIGCPTANGTALDTSEAALAVAGENFRRQNVDKRITAIHGATLNALRSSEAAPFDIIVANPPYIPTAEVEDLEPEVRDHDPRLALDGGPDGLDFYRVLSKELPIWIKPDGVLMMEIGDGQAADVHALFSADGWGVEPVIRDYSGCERILIARRSD